MSRGTLRAIHYYRFEYAGVAFYVFMFKCFRSIHPIDENTAEADSCILDDNSYPPVNRSLL